MLNRRVLLTTAVVVGGLGCQERFESQYATVAAARAAGAMERGWLPSWLPDDVHDIREVHDLDTNVVFAMYRQARSRTAVVPNVCAPAAWADAPVPDARPAWWPATVPPRLTGAVSPHVYRCGAAFLAIHDDSEVVYYWRTAG